MSDDEAAAYLHVKPSTLRTMVRENRVPYSRLGERTVVFLREVLDLWLIMATVGPDAGRLKERVLELRRAGALPTGIPLTSAEESMLAKSRRDVAAGRVFRLSDR